MLKLRLNWERSGDADVYLDVAGAGVTDSWLVALAY